jgi:hypothetical protein
MFKIEGPHLVVGFLAALSHGRRQKGERACKSKRLNWKPQALS